MLAVIKLPGNVTADLYEDGWSCAYDYAMPVLEYLTKRIPGDRSQMNVEQIARAVVAMVKGAEFVSLIALQVPSRRPTAEDEKRNEQIFAIVRRVRSGTISQQQGMEEMIAAGQSHEDAEWYLTHLRRGVLGQSENRPQESSPQRR